MSITLSSKTIFVAGVAWWAILQFVGNINTWDASTFLIAAMLTAGVYKYVWEEK